jgi:hypothetical protein
MPAADRDALTDRTLLVRAESVAFRGALRCRLTDRGVAWPELPSAWPRVPLRVGWDCRWERRGLPWRPMM